MAKRLPASTFAILKCKYDKLYFPEGVSFGFLKNKKVSRNNKAMLHVILLLLVKGEGNFCTRKPAVVTFYRFLSFLNDFSLKCWEACASQKL